MSKTKPPSGSFTERKRKPSSKRSKSSNENDRHQGKATSTVEGDIAHDRPQTTESNPGTIEPKKKYRTKIGKKQDFFDETPTQIPPDETVPLDARLQVTAKQHRSLIPDPDVFDDTGLLTYENLPLAFQAVKEAIDVCEAQIKPNGDIEACCKIYSKAARSLAALILTEQIRKMCEGMTEMTRPSSSEQFATLEKKTRFADKIRHLLAPWNFGFRDSDESENKVYQIYAGSAGGTFSKFVLNEYGSGNTISAWEKVVKIISKPCLVDVTKFSLRRESRKR